MTLAVALLLGVLIGLALGALGGGGSILTVPALVYALDEPAPAATTASLVIVGITSTVGAVEHARSGNVRWLPGLAFGVVGVATSFLGTALNRHVDPDVLLLSFAGLMLVAAAAMLHRSTRAPAPKAAAPGRRRRADTVKLAVAGLAVGFLTGFLGVGGGFIVVTALVVVLGFAMPVAVGTSLLVIAINCAAALLARVGSETFHWAVIVPFAAAAVVGALLGKRLSGRVAGATLTRTFAGLLIAVAVYTGVRSAAGLW